MSRKRKGKGEESVVHTSGKMNDYLKILNNPYCSIMSNGSMYDSDKYFSTGNYMLNALITGDIYQGIQDNKTIAFAGEESTGKSFLALGIVKSFLQDNPSGVVFVHETEGAWDTETLARFNIPLDRVIQNPIETVERFKIQACQLVDAYLAKTKEEKEAEPWLWVLDSLSEMPTLKEATDAAEGSTKQDMTRAKVIRSVFRVLDLKLALAKIPFIMTSHVYVPVGDMFPQPKVGGGLGVRYCNDCIIMLGKSKINDKDEDGNKTQTGINVKAKIFKSRKTKAGAIVNFVINFNKGLDKYSGLTDFCIDTGLIQCPTKGYYAWHGTEDKLRLSAIENNFSTFYSKERLDEINLKCHDTFRFNSSESLEEKEDCTNSTEEVT